MKKKQEFSPIEIAELRILAYNRLVKANAPEQIQRMARDQIMKSRAELIRNAIRP